MSLTASLDALAAKIAAAVQATVPPDWRGVLRIAVDNGKCNAHDVTVEHRPPQPRRVMIKPL